MSSCSHAPRRRRWVFAALLLTGAALATLAGACGGGGEEKATGGAATQTTAAGEETPAAATTSGAGGGEDAAAAISKLAKEYQTFTGKIRYEIKDFSDAGVTDMSAMTFYQKGDKSRTDIESPDGNVIFINTPDANYMCTENQCLKSAGSSSTGDSLASFAEFINPAQVESIFGSLPRGVDIKKSSAKIAGISATCFSAEGDLDPETPGDESGEVCFSEDGLMLRLKFAAGGESGTFEATEASTSVADKSFEPPFEVIDLSDLGQ